MLAIKLQKFSEISNSNTVINNMWYFKYLKINDADMLSTVIYNTVNNFE